MMINKIFLFIASIIIFTSHYLISQTWNSQNSGTTYTLNCVYFINFNTGWVVGNGGTILYTSNGGTTWTAQNSEIPYILNGVFFIDELTGFISGYNGTILKTTNGGNNWFFANSGAVSNLYNLYKIKFTNYNTGYTSGTGGKILKTTNGGNYWDTTFSFYSQYYTCYDLLFVNESTGWACMNSNYIYRTSNSGYNWTLVGGGGAGYNSRSITKSQYFFWVCREAANDLVRSDNGLSFYQLNNNLNVTCYCISFLNDYTGYAAGINYIKKSTNSGENWITEINSGTTYYSLFAINSDNVWAVGSGGTIIAKRIPVGIEEQEITSDNYELSQNYPNPFNPVTKIRFDVSGHPPYPPSKGEKNVTLKVYDILGKEIQTIVNEQLQPGSYEVTFDGSNLPSGGYFYQLRAGDYVETKKLVLLK